MAIIVRDAVVHELVCELTKDSDITAAKSLRYRVWENEGVTLSAAQSRLIVDCHDDHAVHWGGRRW